MENVPARPSRAAEPASFAEIDGVRALGTQLSRIDGRVGTLADQAASGSLLVVVAEHTCPAAQAAVAALTTTSGRIAVVCQGRFEAAWTLVEATFAHDLDVWVEPGPHRVSEALAAATVPTFVLFEGLQPVAWQDGWDREVVASLVSRVGGELATDAGDAAQVAGCPSRLGADASQLAGWEAEDALLIRPRDPQPPA